MSPIVSLLTGFVPSAILKYAGVNELISTVLRGEAPSYVRKGMEFLAAATSSPSVVTALTESASEKGVDLKCKCEHAIPLVEQMCGFKTEGEWHERVNALCTHLLSIQQEEVRMKAVVICPYCDQIHGV